MEEIVKLLSKVSKKYPRYVIKVDNIRFLIENLKFRQNRVAVEQRKIDKYAQKIIDGEKPIARFDIREITKWHTQDPDPESTSKYNGIFSDTGFNLSINPLLFEFNSLIVTIISTIDNTIDLYVSIRYSPHPKGIHWDLGDFVRGKYGKRVDFSSSPILPIVKKDYTDWINNIEHLRHEIIHRIANKQRVDLYYYLTYRTGEVSYHFSGPYGFKMSFNLFGEKKVEELANLMNTIITELLS